MTVLTSTGNVNLTSSTNWSPAQIPVAGDDLIIGAHTLTLDADLRLDSIRFNNASSRLAISGTSRSVEATNGFQVNASIGTIGVSAIPAGTTLTLTGQWIFVTNVNLSVIFNSTGGNLILQTVGSSQSNVLIDGTVLTSGTFAICNSWTGGNLTTIGRMQAPNSFAGLTLITMSGGTWTHQSVGMNAFGVGSFRFCNLTGTATVNWTGSVDIAANTNAVGLFGLASTSVSHTIGQSGDTFCLRNASLGANSFTSLMNIASGAVVLNGQWSSRLGGYAIFQTGGLITYTNQTYTIPSTDYFTVLGNGGTLNISGLKISTTKGAVLTSYGAHVITSDAQTLFTGLSASAMFGAYFNTGLESRFAILESSPPTLPAVQNVASGTVYGYSASPLNGTGIIHDPATIAAAVGTAMESLSVNALKRFVTVNTGETAAADGSVAKLAQGGAASVDLTPVLEKLPLTGRAAKPGDAMTLDSATLTALFADVDTGALVASIVQQFDEATDLPADTIATLAATRTVTALATLIADAAAAKTAAQSADGKLSAGRLSRVDRLPDVAAGTTGGLALHGATGGGSLTPQQEATLNGIAAELSGSRTITPTGRVAKGGMVTAYIGDDFKVRSGTELPIPVADVGAAIKTKLEAIGIENLRFGAAPTEGEPGAITGTISGITAASGITTISIEISNCGADLMPGDMPYQIQQTQQHGSEFDDYIELEGTLRLKARTVAAVG